MTPRLLTVLLLAVLPCAAPATGQVLTRALSEPPPWSDPPALDYLATSAGVDAPALDGGRIEIEMADLDDDGHLDLVTVGDHGSPFINTPQHGVTVWFGDGAGGWTLQQTGDFGYGGLAVGDVNGDGHADVAYGVHHNYSGTDLGDQLLEVALGDGSGTAWTPWDDGLATAGETWGMFGTDLGDIDADGDLDVGSISFGCCAGAHVYRNEGDGTWTHTWGFLGGNSNVVFRFGDVDGDGHLDALAGHQDGRVFLGDGTGAFTPDDAGLPAAAWIGLGAGDVDGDGDDELSFAVGGGLAVFDREPGGGWTSRSVGLPGNGPFDLTELCDMDGDGAVDLAAFGNGTFAVYRFDGAAWTLAFSMTTPGDGGKNGEAFRTGGDLDHNGRPDVSLVQEELTGLFNSQNVHVLLFETSVPTELTARVVEPSAHRTWRAGQTRFVDWAAAVPRGQSGVVTLELSVTGVAGPWIPLGSGLANDGRHQIRLPSGISASDARVRLTVATGAATATALSSRFRVLP